MRPSVISEQPTSEHLSACLFGIQSVHKTKTEKTAHALEYSISTSSAMAASGAPPPQMMSQTVYYQALGDPISRSFKSWKELTHQGPNLVDREAVGRKISIMVAWRPVAQLREG